LLFITFFCSFPHLCCCSLLWWVSEGCVSWWEPYGGAH